MSEKIGQFKLVKEWFTSVKKSTRKQYENRFSHFLKHIDMTPNKFLNLVKRNKIKGKTLINEWYNHLREDDKSLNYCALSEDTIKSFLRYHEIPIRTPKREKARNHRRKVLRIDDIRKLVEYTPFLRDKALIVLALQTGMSISDLINLNYGDVKDAIENEKDIFIIEYIRGKKGTESIAIMGKDSIDYLKHYINWKKTKNHNITTETPLFTVIKDNVPKDSPKKIDYTQKRIAIRTTQQMIRETVIKSGLTTLEKLKKHKKFNPFGFHAIRKAFSSIARVNGLPFEQVEMSMGHTLSYGGAYTEFTDEELIKNYRKVEKFLSVSIDMEDIRKKTEQLTTLEQELQKLTERLNKLETKEEARLKTTENDSKD